MINPGKNKYEIIKNNQKTLWEALLEKPVLLGSSKVPNIIRYLANSKSDNNSSGSFFYDYNNNLKFKDFATGICWDIIEFASKLYKVNRATAASMLLKQADPSKVEVKFKKNFKERSKYKRHKSEIKVYIRKYTKSDYEYWESYGVSKDMLLANRVLATKKIELTNRYDEWFVAKLKGPTFSYHFNRTDSYKIYSPYDEKFKWLGNTSINNIYGYYTTLASSGKNLIITSSGKDYMCLKSLAIKYNLNYDVIATNSEGYLIPEYYRNKLLSRFDNWFILYDNDEPGIKYAKSHSDTYSCKYILVEGAKDPSDLFFYKGEQELLNQINNLI